MKWYLDENVSWRLSKRLDNQHQIDITSCFLTLPDRWYRRRKDFRGIGIFSPSVQQNNIQEQSGLILEADQQSQWPKNTVRYLS